MIASQLRLSVLCLAPLLLLAAASSVQVSTAPEQPDASAGVRAEKQVKKQALKAHYLEIVTPLVNETCEALAEAHGVVFGEPVAEFGNARTADLEGGGRIGVRAPMGETEKPIVRPYILVDDIEAAVKAAEKAGAKVALPPMEIPGQGTISIYILGGIEHGLWQL